MKRRRFSVILAAVSKSDVEIRDAMDAAGCEDFVIGNRNGVMSVHFHPRAASLGKAIGSAVKKVERAGFSVARIEVKDA